MGGHTYGVTEAYTGVPATVHVYAQTGTPYPPPDAVITELWVRLTYTDKVEVQRIPLHAGRGRPHTLNRCGRTARDYLRKIGAIPETAALYPIKRGWDDSSGAEISRMYKVRNVLGGTRG